MAAKISETLGIEPTLIAQGQGIFDVMLDDRLVYSKFNTGSFPDETSLVAELQSKICAV